jgi:hypothetical protein
MAVSMSADGGTKAYSDPQPMSVSMTSYAADARTNAADADTTDARTNASDTSDPANATDASDATYTTGNTASGATSSTSGGTSSTCGGTSSTSGGTSSTCGGTSSTCGGTSSTSGGTSSTSGGTSSTCGGTSGASYTTGNAASYRQRDSADRERCNPETCADDSHTRSSMILSPVMNSEPERHSRRSLTLARVIGRGIRSENDLGKL